MPKRYAKKSFSWILATGIRHGEGMIVICRRSRISHTVPVLLRMVREGKLLHAFMLLEFKVIVEIGIALTVEGQQP